MDTNSAGSEGVDSGTINNNSQFTNKPSNEEAEIHDVSSTSESECNGESETDKLNKNDAVSKSLVHKDWDYNKARFLKTVYAKHFSVQPFSNSKQVLLKCNWKTGDGLCGNQVMLQKNTYSNVKNHLKKKHGHDITERGSEPAQKPLDSKQLTLESFRDRKTKYPRNHPKQIKFDSNVVRMFAIDGCPFDSVKKRGFQKLVTNLNPKIRVKSRQCYVQKLKTLVEKEIIPQCKAKLASIPKRNCHFSCDIWSTRKSEGVLGIIAHYIDNQWDLRRQVLLFQALEERHTANYIRTEFLKCLAEYKVPMDWGGYVVTDNAANMKKSFNLEDIELEKLRTAYPILLSEEEQRLVVGETPDSDDSEDSEPESESSDDDNDLAVCEADNFIAQLVIEFASNLYSNSVDIPISGHMTCASHSLQLAINDALKRDCQAKEFISYINKIMVFFKKSTAWRDELRKDTNLGPRVPCKTRWNGSLDMLERFKNDKFFAAVRNVLDRAYLTSSGSARDRLPQSPNVVEQKKAQELYSLLKPLGDATDKLQADGLTANLLIVYSCLSFQRLLKIKPSYFNTFRTTILGNLKIRMEPYISRKEYIIAGLLDPRFKSSVFKLEQIGAEHDMILKLPSYQEAMQILKTEFANERKVETSTHTVPENPSNDVTEINGEDDIFGLLRNAMTTPTSEKNEIDYYMGEQLSATSSCPLLFWKCNEARFPILTKLAMRFLSVPATSAGVERMFSISGAISSARRSNISLHNISNLLMVRCSCESEMNVAEGSKMVTSRHKVK